MNIVSSQFQISDSEILLRWKQPRYDGHSSVLCYSLQYQQLRAGGGAPAADADWTQLADNIDHEFFLVRQLQSHTHYHFRLAARNRIGWSDMGIPRVIQTAAPGTAEPITISKAMKHLQDYTEAGTPVLIDDAVQHIDYHLERAPIDWDASPDTVLDRYSFISEISRGRFSIVVKAVEKATDRVLVAKVFALTGDASAESKVQSELEAFRTLRHERIVGLVAAFRPTAIPVAVLVQEKLQGADVLTYLSSRHEYTEQHVCAIITQTLDALQYLHWRGYCHLNVQPDNIVMASVRSVQIKLVDFGAAQRVSKVGTKVSVTPEMSATNVWLDGLAPELVSDEPAFPQTDIWSVGVLAYVLLSGHSPFRGADDAETKQNISFVRYRFENLYKEMTPEATRFIMFVFKRTPK